MNKQSEEEFNLNKLVTLVDIHKTNKARNIDLFFEHIVTIVFTKKIDDSMYTYSTYIAFYRVDISDKSIEELKSIGHWGKSGINSVFNTLSKVIDSINKSIKQEKSNYLKLNKVIKALKD